MFNLKPLKGVSHLDFDYTSTPMLKIVGPAEALRLACTCTLAAVICHAPIMLNLACLKCNEWLQPGPRPSTTTRRLGVQLTYSKAATLCLSSDHLFLSINLLFSAISAVLYSCSALSFLHHVPTPSTISMGHHSRHGATATRSIACRTRTYPR